MAYLVENKEKMSLDTDALHCYNASNDNSGKLKQKGNHILPNRARVAKAIQKETPKARQPEQSVS